MNAGHAALVLAAGASTRLGRPKQSLMRAGETLLHRAARLALATAPRRCLIALGAEAAALCPLLADLPVEIVEVDGWRAGLGASLASLRAALGEAAVSRVLILGCDQPALELAHLQALLDAAAPGRPAFSGYAGVRGLPAVVPLPQWRAATLSGDVGLRALARAADGAADAIAVIDAPDLALDIDTPADLEDAISRGWLQPPA